MTACLQSEREGKAEPSGGTRWAGHGIGWVESEAIYMALAGQHGVKALHRLLLYVVLTYRGRAGLMNPSLESLVKRTGAAISTVQRALRDLRAWGLLEWKTGGRRGQERISNHYKAGPTLVEHLASFELPNRQSSNGHNTDQQKTEFCDGHNTDQQRKRSDQASVGQPTDSPVGQVVEAAVGHSSDQGSTSLEANTLEATTRSKEKPCVFSKKDELLSSSERPRDGQLLSSSKVRKQTSDHSPRWCPAHSREPELVEGKWVCAQRFCPTAERLNRESTPLQTEPVASQPETTESL